MKTKLPLEDTMRNLLQNRKINSSLRTLSIAPPSSIDFSSNDFLSLSTSPLLRRAYLTELSSHSSFKLGSGGSRLLDGNSSYAEELEKEIASFHGADAGLLFNSGYDANSGFFSCVPMKGDVVLFDEHIHASVHEGMRLSRAENRVAFKHNSVGDLRRIIGEVLMDGSFIRDEKRNVFVAIESLYSMDGDLAPIKEIVELVEELLPRGNGHVVVDEAHSNGVYGFQGRGIVCNLGLEDRIFARLHTFGKGLACNGAILLCSPLTREYLINYARSLIYTTAMSIPSLAAIKTVYALMKQGLTQPLILHLHQLIAHLYFQLQELKPLLTKQCSGAHLLQLPQQMPQSPIFALLTPKPRILAKFCQDGGFIVRPIVPPTVLEGTQRVRVCLHAGNSFKDVERLVARIKVWLESMESAEAEDIPNLEMIKSVL